MNAPPPQLHYVFGTDGKSVALGSLQIEWLLERGLIAKTDSPDPSVNSYKAEMPHLELHKLVWAQPTLRECDFCRQPDAPWIVHCAPFKVVLAGAEATLGGDVRPLVACNVCEAFIRDNRKQALIEYGISQVIASADAGGGYLRAVVRSNPSDVLRAQIRPQIQSVVMGMFANRRGFPVKG